MAATSQTVIDFIKRRKANLRSVFHSKCCLCGFDEVQEALEFHHVKEEEKEFSICSSSNQTKALEPQLKELKKCILLCANCHRGVHAGIYQVPENWQDFYDNEIAEKLLTDLQEIKTHKIYYCKNCGKEIKTKSQYCVECGHEVQRKCERPSREELKEKIRTQSFLSIGREYGVTDNAIRKWCILEGLPKKKTEINQYTDEEWAKI